MSSELIHQSIQTRTDVSDHLQNGVTNRQDHSNDVVKPQDVADEYVRPVIAELVGMFTFVFIGAGSIVENSLPQNATGLLGIALAHGLVLAILICAFGAISGGHFNPAVTISLCVTRHIAPLKALFYIIAQLVGGTLGALLLRAVFPATVWQAAHLGTPSLAPGLSFGLGILIEVVLTFFLLMSVFGTAVDPRAPKIGGFGIGLTILFDILVGGPLTGAAMNPAIAFGPALAGGYWQDQFVYWIGPIIGGIIAALIYQYLILPARQAR